MAGLDEQCPPTKPLVGGHSPAVVFMLKNENLEGNAALVPLNRVGQSLVYPLA